MRHSNQQQGGLGARGGRDGFRNTDQNTENQEANNTEEGTALNASPELLEIDEQEGITGAVSEDNTGAESGRGGRGGRERAELEDITQSVTNNDDGSIDISVSGTDPEGEVRTFNANISDNESGGIDILTSCEKEEPEEALEEGEENSSREKVVTISEDSEDGGVDIDIQITNAEGEMITQHIELDMNDDGTLSFEKTFEHDDELIVHQRDLDLALFLGGEGETLNVAEVVEAYLDKGPIDMTDVELTGLNNLMTGADFFEI